MSRSRTSLIALVVLAVLAMGLTGCRRNRMVVINGERITNDAYLAKLEKVVVQTPSGPQLAGRYVLQQILDEELTKQLAKKEGVEPTDKQIERKVKAIKTIYGPDFRPYLAQQGLTEPDWRSALTVEQARLNLAAKGATVPESDTKKAYDQMLKAKPYPFVKPPQAKAAVIIASQKAKIDKAYSLLNQGQEFGTVAMQLSEDATTKQMEGRIPFPVAPGDKRLPKSVTTTIYSLSAGKYSKPFFTDGSWVIVRTETKRPATTAKYEDAKLLIEERLKAGAGMKKNDIFGKMLKFTKSAKIEIFADRYKDIPETMKKNAAKGLEMQAKQLAGQKVPAGKTTP